jgi:ADP-heptose:LPS heptosyltransferase
LTETEQAEAQALLDRFGLRRRFLAASIGAKVEAKDWTEPNWLALLAKLAAQYPALPLVMIGAEDERARSERCLAMWRGPQANLCGMTSPRVSAAILQHAGLFLGHDSGPMHLAACMGTACVAIFAARTPPGQWFPRGAQHTILYRRTPCAGCQLDVCTEHHKQCLLSITVEEVFTAVNKHLAGSEGQAVIPSQ